MKYFWSLSGILGKIGTTAPIDVSLSLVASSSTPVLLHGFDSGCLSNAQIERVNHPFSSIYTKLFATFDKSVIMQCQFYTGQLPLKYVLDLKFLNFINGLRYLNNSPAELLYDWFGVD